MGMRNRGGKSECRNPKQWAEIEKLRKVRERSGLFFFLKIVALTSAASKLKPWPPLRSSDFNSSDHRRRRPPPHPRPRQAALSTPKDSNNHGLHGLHRWEKSPSPNAPHIRENPCHPWSKTHPSKARGSNHRLHFSCRVSDVRGQMRGIDFPGRIENRPRLARRQVATAPGRTLPPASRPSRISRRARPRCNCRG